MKKISKRQREEVENKKGDKITNWFCFLFGIALSIGGLRRLFSGHIGVQMNSRTNYPILSNGLYPLFIGFIMIGVGVYRVFFLKKK